MKTSFPKLLAIIGLFILSFTTTTKAQEYLGFSGSNYAGVNSVILQPAAVVDSRFIADINLISGGTTISNNYVKLNVKELVKNGFPELDSNYTFQDYRFDNVFEKTNSKSKNVYLGQDVLGPSFMVTINRKNAFAITTRARAIVNVDNFLQDALELGLSEFTEETLLNQQFSLNESRISTMVWGEIGGTYGRVLYNEGEHFVKAGITLKYLMGVASFYLYNEDVEVTFFAGDSLSVNEPSVTANDATFRTGLSNNVDFDDVSVSNFASKIPGKGIGLDIGAVYEYRPDYADYLAGEDEMRNKNKYMVRAEFSVLDIGSLKFDKHPETYDFGLNWQNYNLANVQVSEDGNWLDSLGVTRLSDDERTYKMTLPTSYYASVDYRPFKKASFYVNASAFMATRNYKNENKIRAISRYTITPRFEKWWFGIGLPISYNSFGYATFGTYLHLGPFFVGSADVWNYFLSDGVQGFNMYGGIKIPIPYGNKKNKKDTDGDGVIDKIDKCVTEPGPVENDGCPWGDKDNDGVLDNVDQCVEVPGPVENNGCPWPDTDSDGVTDNVDECVDVAGPEENNGCPWPDTDGDGLTDNVDACPDSIGPEENNGCPWPDTDGDGLLDKDDDCPDAAGPEENKGCPYGDSDGDGVLDNDDECPKTFGLAENNGCPVLKQEEEAIVKRAFSNLEFDLGKDVIRASSFSSLNELADLMGQNPEWKLKLAGHTDNVGNDAANMKLSKDRATAVKTLLVARGVSEDRIQVEFYGETRPIADNDKPEGRQKNRRVEMTIVFE